MIRQIGLTERLSAAVNDWRHPSYITHEMREMIAQRFYQIYCAYADGNEANALRCDSLFKLGLERKPLDAAMDLASAPTFSRPENGVGVRDRYRIAQAFVETFISSYSKAPQVMVLQSLQFEEPNRPRAPVSNMLSPTVSGLPLLVTANLSRLTA